MSYYNTHKNPFPFYNLEGEIWTNTKPLWFKNNCASHCCYNHKIGLGTQFFQLIIDSQIVAVNQITVNLRRVSDNTIINDTIIDLLVYLDSTSTKHLLIALLVDASLMGDEYYISVETDFGNYYSEIFCVSTIDNKFVTIEWASTKGLVGKLLYDNTFKHSINVEAVIVPLEPELEEETEEDGQGNEYPTLQKLRQGHQLSFIVPNFIAQAISAIPLHDKVNFVNRYLGETPTELQEKNKYVTCVITPEQDGCYSFVEISYIEETIVSTACDSPIANIELFDLNLFWTDTEGTEDRSCDNIPCTLEATSTGNIEVFTIVVRQISDDGGNTWQTIGYGLGDIEHTFYEPGIYSIRLFIVTQFGAQIISNILNYEVT
ncbi:hypothetical protein [Gaetbulibacter sp. PBL-D1]|uniref:hypothetical protein n=1 Tax=Gaetbulibacter sp. PBL-D1 TaxID=3422594 RepID=UPI003D2F182C